MNSGNIIEINIVNMGSILVMFAAGALILSFARKLAMGRSGMIGNQATAGGAV